MAAGYKTLGQISPTAGANTTLYTATTGGTVSTLAVCNTSGLQATFRVAIRVGGATIATKHYIVYDAVLPVTGSKFLTLGLSFASTDIFTVYASTSGVAFTLSGVDGL